MLAGVLFKIGVLRKVLAKVLFLLFSFMDTSVGTLASTPQSTPILGSTPQEFSGAILGVFPFPASLPGQEVPYKRSQKGVPGPPGPECQKSVEKVPNDPKMSQKDYKMSVPEPFRHFF